MTGQEQHAKFASFFFYGVNQRLIPEFALTIAQSAHTPLESTNAAEQWQYTLHKAWCMIKWQDLALHRHSAVVEYII